MVERLRGSCAEGTSFIAGELLGLGSRSTPSRPSYGVVAIARKPGRFHIDARPGRVSDDFGVGGEDTSVEFVRGPGRGQSLKAFVADAVSCLSREAGGRDGLVSWPAELLKDIGVARASSASSSPGSEARAAVTRGEAGREGLVEAGLALSPVVGSSSSGTLVGSCLSETSRGGESQGQTEAGQVPGCGEGLGYWDFRVQEARVEEARARALMVMELGRVREMERDFMKSRSAFAEGFGTGE